MRPPALKVGVKVIFERYGFDVGTVTRVGVSTATIKEDGPYGYSNSRVEFRHIYPATEENLKLLGNLETTKEALETVSKPYEEKLSLLREAIRETRWK